MLQLSRISWRYNPEGASSVIFVRRASRQSLAYAAGGSLVHVLTLYSDTLLILILTTLLLSLLLYCCCIPKKRVRENDVGTGNALLAFCCLRWSTWSGYALAALSSSQHHDQLKPTAPSRATTVSCHDAPTVVTPPCSDCSLQVQNSRYISRSSCRIIYP